MTLHDHEPAWLARARQAIGVREFAGLRHNTTILDYFAKAGFAGIKRDEVPWCAAFANAVLNDVGIKGTGSLLARSFLGFGEKLDAPRIGAIVVLRRGTSTWSGHVGFLTGWDETHFQLLGGNQADRVSIARYARSHCLGLRWPKGVAFPARQGTQATRRTTTALNLRDLPRPAAGRILTTLAASTPVTVLETWHRVEAGGRQGWVNDRYTQPA